MVGARLIRLYYLLLVAFLCINATTLSITQVWPAVALMWLCYGSFRVGVGDVSRAMRCQRSAFPVQAYWLAGPRKLVVAAVVIASSALAAQFYTGQSVVGVISKLSSQTAMYWEYQEHFAAAELGVRSWHKAPYVLMLFAVKAMLLYCFVVLVALKPANSSGEKVLLGIVTLSHLFFSAARGTSFELFEVFFLAAYCLSERVARYRCGIGLGVAGRRWVFFGGLAFLLLFNHYYGARGTGRIYVTADIGYDPHSLLAQAAPSVGLLSVALASYFAFGFHYVAVAIVQVWWRSVGCFLSGLVPLGMEHCGVSSLHEEVSSLIDCGVTWIPDVARCLEALGFSGTMVVCYLLGRVCRREKAAKPEPPYVEVARFLAVLQMLSMPVGNFIWMSSSNTLVVALVGGLASLRKLHRFAGMKSVRLEQSGVAERRRRAL